ncbi:ABC transporter permease [Glacieibacterium megasporae]|uniref:ABC transporter permease n=1 Tax=Glacieibacterium megasporae TaxID=2835787 RepID=UPI001C1DD81E|nr:ABC transporter permease [Polymorphobacter megasporae]UAJ09767.1 ABC transporter permease [Polymorphobacter megasporae]
MNRFALLTFYRSLTRHKLYATLNIGGLAVGIAVFVVLGLYVRFETSYERWLPGHDQVYLVEARQKALDPRPGQYSPIAMWSAVHRDVPGIVGTRLVPRSATVLKDGIGVQEQLALVDPAFATVFRLPTVAGDLAAALVDPTAVVVTQKTATKYFGTASPIGKAMTITYEGASHAYRVAAVIADLPKNTDLEFDMLVRLLISEAPAPVTFNSTHYWNYFEAQTYVRLPSPADISRVIGQLTAVAARHSRVETPDDPDNTFEISLQPIADVHFETAGAKLAVTTLGIVGVLTLLIATVNYVNLATARAGLRAREVAMRKVLGASRAVLARNYVGEAVATAAIAGVIGLALAESGLPLVNAAGGLSLSIQYFGWDGTLLPWLLLVILVGVGAGLYPALVLSRFPAAAVLASARSPGGGRWGTRVREALVVLQFAIAIAFMIGTGVLVAQTDHIRSADPGYTRQGLLLVRSLGSDSLTAGQRDSIVHRLRSLPAAQAVTVANGVPGGGLFGAQTNVEIPGEPGHGPTIAFFEISPGFFEALGGHLVAGRMFDPARPGDINANLDVVGKDGTIPSNIILNRSGVTALHFASPQAAIGKTVGGKNPRTVIGVVEDMRFTSPRAPVPPTMYDFQLRDMRQPIAILRFTGDPKAMLEAVQQAWRQEAPEVPFQAKTVVQALNQYYERDDHSALLFTIGAVLAVVIGCVGLWGLASFNTARRVKEIGIRKTLGASSTDIVRLLVGQFLRPVLIANLFAWPLAYFAMRTWLAGFNDRIDLSPLFFVAATLLALVIAVLTVFAQSLRAARSTPAWALRHD